jgi:hypothetical protein
VGICLRPKSEGAKNLALGWRVSQVDAENATFALALSFLYVGNGDWSLGRLKTELQPLFTCYNKSQPAFSFTTSTAHIHSYSMSNHINTWQDQRKLEEAKDAVPELKAITRRRPRSGESRIKHLIL